MKEELRILVYGAFFGVFVGAGALFLCFWWIVWTSPNAGAIVEGTFRPYHQDSSIHVTLLGGVIMLGAGAAGLVRGWGKVDRGETL